MSNVSRKLPELNAFIRILVRINNDKSTVNCSSVTGAIVLVINVLEGTPKPIGGVVWLRVECRRLRVCRSVT